MNLDEEKKAKTDFIRSIINEDLATNKTNGKVRTRFPPEPNGYLHIGHAKSICLNFGIAREYNANCNLRFDDTNPVKEDIEYVEAIRRDINWLGFSWGESEFFASDYFGKLYDLAIELIRRGKAYVCDLNADQVREYRGTLTEPGKNSPYRDRSVAENLALFEKMKNGEFEEGACVLRAKIDMAHPNMNMRDPAIYRIKKATHHRTGDQWCIYPMYDWAHGLCDAFEGITHSLCSLEFEDHRPLYDWFIDQLPMDCHPRQIEFARLNLNYTVLSKRKLLKLVKEGYVSGWNDPRMPTISGLKRRGYTPQSIREFCSRIGIAKSNSVVDYSLLEFCIREDLNKTAQRKMAVINPLKVIITNYDENWEDKVFAINNPEDPESGKREISFTRELWIEKDDFMENPPKKFFRLSPGQEIRLKYAYLIRCDKVVKNDLGEVVELHCTYNPDSANGKTPEGKKVKGTAHWVSARHAIAAEVRLYDRLFTTENPEVTPEGKDFTDYLNPLSLQVLKNCWLEPSMKEMQVEDRCQFERLGYFSKDLDSTETLPVFNRIVTLKESK